MASIHSTAIVAPEARLGSGVEIGPFCVVGPHVELGDGVRLVSHVSIVGHTRLGAGCEVFPFASLGHKPQDLKFRGELSWLEIGEGTQIREHVTVNPGTEHGGLHTRVGRRCLLMVNAHVAHDCQLGDGAILGNNVMLAGHVSIGEGAILGGGAAVLQFCRVGRRAMIGGMAGVTQDVIPFGMVMGLRTGLDGLNLVGLRRAGLPREQVEGLRSAYEELFAEGGALEDRIARIRGAWGDNPLVADMLDFVEARSKHGVLRPRHDG